MKIMKDGEGRELGREKERSRLGHGLGQTVILHV